MRSIHIVIPAYNEEEVIADVVRDVRSLGYRQIIVVDDGSQDLTFQKAKQSGALTLRHIINRGKGAAVKTGLEAAKILDAQSVITFDGDGQHDPQDIDKMIRKLNNGYDVVLGTRFLRRQHVPRLKIIYNWIANIITWSLYGVWTTDSQSGFRAYGEKALSVLDTKTDRYEFDSEVIREISRNNLKYCEIPIKVRYTAYSQGKKDKQNILSAFISVVKLFLLS